jgi:hypothetical protein
MVEDGRGRRGINKRSLVEDQAKAQDDENLDEEHNLKHDSQFQPLG